MSYYQSKMMRLIHDDDECPVCMFLSGNHDPEIMHLVIERLDGKLADVERTLDVCIDLLRTKPCGSSPA